MKRNIDYDIDVVAQNNSKVEYIDLVTNKTPKALSEEAIQKGEKRYIKLTKEEEEEEELKLEQGWKSGKKSTFRQRCHYILLSKQGKGVLEIADIYQVTRQTIARWFDRYEEAKIEGLHITKGQGQAPIVRLDNEAEISTIEDLIEESPQNIKPVLAKIEEQMGKKMSKRTLQSLLEKKLNVEAFSKGDS